MAMARHWLNKQSLKPILKPIGGQMKIYQIEQVIVERNNLWERELQLGAAIPVVWDFFT